jgi:O-antigen ligase
MCTAEQMAGIDRLSGFLGPCNRKLGVVMASLSPFLLFAAARRLQITGWLLASAAIGVVVLLAGARAAWITYALVLVFSGWKLLGWKRLLGVFAFGAVLLAVLAMVSPQVRERIRLTTHALTANESGVDTALSGRGQIWSAAGCMIVEHPINGVGARGFREAFPGCDAGAGERPAWGQGPAFHAHQIVLEVLSETGVIGLLLWLAGAALAWRAWRYAAPQAKERARPAMLALAVTVFPFNTHLAFYSTFWGGLTLMLAALYAGSLLARDDE